MIENLNPLADGAILWTFPVPLLTVYVVSLVVGGGMLLISTLFGGHAGTDVHVDGDFSFSGDVHADVPSDVHVDPSGGTDGALDGVAGHGHEWFSLTSWFSISFVVYFLAVFGLVGTSLSFLSEIESGKVAALALATGLIAGQGVHQLLRFLRRTSGNSALNMSEYLNRSACVTIAIDGHKKGEVAVSVRGGTRYLPAAARQPDKRFNKGDHVVIISINDAIAEVVSRDEHVASTGSQSV